MMSNLKDIFLEMSIPCHPEHTFPKPPKIKNCTTSHANRCQNGAKSRSGGDLGSFWAALGVSWASPGPKAPLCRFPGAFWAAFRWFLKRLGRLLGGSWAILGTKLGRPGGILERFTLIFMDQVHLYL